MDIGSNVKKYREDAAISQTELAELIGIAQPMISQIERGTKIPTMPLGKEIADALGCKLDDLVK